MLKHSTLGAVLGLFAASMAQAFDFASIDGGSLSLNDWRGGPVLVVNTASQCGFTHQYSDLQALQDKYQDRGLVVLAVPSDDFRQELGSNEAVKEFCELNYDLTLPMTEITSVRGEAAHPFYEWLRVEKGFVPRWNFNKVLLGPDGDVIATFGASTKPLSQAVVAPIEALLD